MDLPYQCYLSAVFRIAVSVVLSCVCFDSFSMASFNSSMISILFSSLFSVVSCVVLDLTISLVCMPFVSLLKESSEVIFSSWL